MVESFLRIPSGMRDWLNGEAEKKRSLTNRFLEIAGSYGYEEVTTPILEYYQVLAQGESGQESDQLYKLIDRDGSIIALRSEMTTPIARLVSSKIQGSAPWRLMYGGEVFRYENIQAGKQREFAQVGVELIGQEGPEADGEVLALAIEALQKIGLASFMVSLGHTGVLAGIMQSFAEDEKARTKARALILEKDFVGLQQLLSKIGMDNNIIERIIGLLTRPFHSWDELNECQDLLPAALQAALAELRQVWQVVEDYGYASFIQADLSTLRHQNYYTGMVFEIYTKGIGYPIGGGGRYDRLLRRFGKDCPATGFALGVERLLLSLPAEPPREQTILVAADFETVTAGQLLAQARSWRNEGYPVITELRKLTKLEAEKLAAEKKAKLCWLRGDSSDGL